MNEFPTILVVDDEDAGRFVKVQILRRAGFPVIEAATGAEGLALAVRESPALVVLDVNLPDISGLEVSRRLRTTMVGPPAIQILQISNTSVEPADRVRGLEYGADVYLTEPVDGAVLVATVRSLLRVRRAEARLAEALERERQARETVEEANRLKDDFIATLSHELRTPLNALMGWIWQLRNATLDPAAEARALDSLERNARIQAQLISDLLDISRASKGKLQLEMRLLDLRRIILAAAEGVRDSIASKPLDLRMDLAPVVVAGDEARLQQIVTNLLTNAVQFTPVDGRITVTLAPEGDDAVLTLQDTGAGIDPAFLPHVFDQFKQGEGGLSRKHGGLGLGLSVVRQLVDLHGGSVTVHSAGREQGTTFKVRLPREVHLPAPVESAQPPLLLQDVRALLTAAEDSALPAILESSGAVVITAEAGADGDPVDLVMREEPGRVVFGFPAAPAREWEAVPRSVSPADVVRRIAHYLVRTRTS